MDRLFVPLAYFGPETVMPVTSVIATAAALVMMFGRGSFRLLRLGIRRLFWRKLRGPSAGGPRVHLARQKNSTAASSGANVEHFVRP